MNQPGGYDYIKELPSGKKGRRIYLYMPSGKNPFYNSQLQQSGLQPQTSEPSKLVQQNSSVQKQLADIIYNRIVPAMPNKNKVVTDNNSILAQIIEKQRRNQNDIRSIYQKTKYYYTAEMVSSNLESTLSVLKSYQLCQEYRVSPKKKSPRSKPMNSPETKRVKLTSSPKRSYETLVPVQNAIPEPSQTAITIMEYQLKQLYYDNPGMIYLIQQMRKKLTEMKNMCKVYKGGQSSYSNVYILKVYPIYYPTKDASFIKQLQALEDEAFIEKPRDEVKMEEPLISLQYYESSFNESSFTTMNIKKYIKPDYKEYSIKKVRHEPIEITEDNRDSISSSMYQIQVINKIDYQAVEMLEAEKNQPEVYLPYEEPGCVPYDRSYSSAPEQPLLGTEQGDIPLRRSELVGVVKEIVSSMLRGITLGGGEYAAKHTPQPAPAHSDAMVTQYTVEYIQMEPSQDSESEDAAAVATGGHPTRKAEETPIPNANELRDIPINELSDNQILNEQLSECTGEAERPVNRSGQRSVSASQNEQREMTVEEISVGPSAGDSPVRPAPEGELRPEIELGGAEVRNSPEIYLVKVEPDEAAARSVPTVPALTDNYNTTHDDHVPTVALEERLQKQTAAEEYKSVPELVYGPEPEAYPQYEPTKKDTDYYPPEGGDSSLPPCHSAPCDQDLPYTCSQPPPVYNRTVSDFQKSYDVVGDTFYVPDVVCSRADYQDFCRKFCAFIADPLGYEEPFGAIFTRRNVLLCDFILEQLARQHGITLYSTNGRKPLPDFAAIDEYQQMADLIKIEVRGAAQQQLEYYMSRLYEYLIKRLCLEEASYYAVKTFNAQAKPQEDQVIAVCLEAAGELLGEIIEDVAAGVLEANE